ncbi:predicted protein [Botrytis cinerea T4]|uniref:Uncharacterized protein n=1 Tax=Botryotinia fuckeliana (strain T4) TaxID=999810 RepID=G2XRN3_BOTF4|nr:predicted protein [Botrytis cinerea T4]
MHRVFCIEFLSPVIHDTHLGNLPWPRPLEGSLNLLRRPVYFQSLLLLLFFQHQNLSMMHPSRGDSI